MALPLAALAQGITGPEQDCDFAIPICDLIVNQPLSYTGFGILDDLRLDTSTCLDNNENNSVWYRMEIATSGVLSFTITAMNSTDDYDFALYNLTTLTCSDLQNGNVANVRCNYAYSPGETGMKQGFINASEGTNGLAFLAPLNVTVGEVYYLLIDNFSSTTSGFSIDFSAGSSSFALPNNFAPVLSSLLCNNDSVISIDFPFPFECSSLASDGSDFILTGPSVFTIDSVFSPGCDSTGLFVSALLKYSGSVVNDSVYELIIKQGADSNGLMSTCFELTDTFSLVLQKDLMSVRADFEDSVYGFYITLTDRSENATSWLWNFDDGTQSTKQNPPYIMRPNDGTYSVCLTASNFCGTDSICKPVVIDNSGCSAFFELFPDTIPHHYYVIPALTGIDSITTQWAWGDGSWTNGLYASHTYNDTGTYTICLVMVDSVACMDTYCNSYQLYKAENAMIYVNVIPAPDTIDNATSPMPDDWATLYPNPTNNTLTITAPTLTAIATLILFDALGKEVLNQTAQPHELNKGVVLNVQELSEGVYFLSIRTAAGSRVMKVVKN